MRFCYYVWITSLGCAGSLEAWLEVLLGRSREGFSLDPFSPATKCPAWKGLPPPVSGEDRPLLIVCELRMWALEAPSSWLLPQPRPPASGVHSQCGHRSVLSYNFQGLWAELCAPSPADPHPRPRALPLCSRKPSWQWSPRPLTVSAPSLRGLSPVPPAVWCLETCPIDFGLVVWQCKLWLGCKRKPPSPSVGCLGTVSHALSFAAPSGFIFIGFLHISWKSTGLESRTCRFWEPPFCCWLWGCICLPVY